MKKFKLYPNNNLNSRSNSQPIFYLKNYKLYFQLIGIIVLFLIPFALSNYYIYLINIVGIYSIIVIGLNILLGSTGLISLGHGALFGVGAYVAGILGTTVGTPFLLNLLCAGVITAFVGLIFGIPSSRLKGLYLTIATLAGQFIIEYLITHWESLTKGPMGIILPPPTFFGLNLRGDKRFYWVIIIFLFVFIALSINIFRTKYGRAFIAIRDNERAAEGMGIQIFTYKLFSFGISSFYAGIAGALWAYYMISITSEMFSISLSIELVAMVLIGGMGSITGSILGVIFITFLNEIMRSSTEYFMNLPILSGISLTIAPLREFFLGLIIVIFILYQPGGLIKIWFKFSKYFGLKSLSY